MELVTQELSSFAISHRQLSNGLAFDRREAYLVGKAVQSGGGGLGDFLLPELVS